MRTALPSLRESDLRSQRVLSRAARLKVEFPKRRNTIRNSCGACAGGAVLNGARDVSIPRVPGGVECDASIGMNANILLSPKHRYGAVVLALC